MMKMVDTAVGQSNIRVKRKDPKHRVGQGFCVFGIQGRFKSGIRYIAA